MFRRVLVALTIAAGTQVPTAEAGVFDWIGHVEQDAEGLSSDEPQLRLKAVQDLQPYAIEWTRKHLLGALEDTDPKVRAAAGRVLARHGVAEAVPIIAAWLADPSPQSKQVAAEILGKLGATSALPSLIRSLGDSDPIVRMRIVVALGSIGGDRIIVPLVARLEDRKSDVRLAAVLQLRELKDSRATIPLVGLFDDPNLEVRTAAMEAVGHLGDSTAIPALLRGLDDRVEGVRVAAVTALGELRAQEALAVLMDRMRRGGISLRGKVAYSLGQIAAAHPELPEARQAVSQLVEALASSRLRNGAREALLAAGPSAVPWLIDHLSGKLGGDPATAVMILTTLKDKRATPSLIAELDRGRISQEALLTALSSLGDTRALLPILALLDDDDARVRLRAMRSLDTMIDSSGEAADVIVDRLEDSDIEIRTLAASYLGRMRARSAVPRLTAVVKTAKAPQVRSSALAALGEIADPSSVKIALEILRSGPAPLRMVAVDVLTELNAPDAANALLSLARDPNLPWRHLAIEALAGSLRDQAHPKAEKLMIEVAKSGRLIEALAAIEALGALKTKSLPVLVQLATTVDAARSRAALSVLGSKPASASHTKALLAGLRSSHDSVSAAAAWSLGVMRSSSSTQHLIEATRSRGLATAVNATGALARLATDKHVELFRHLLLHRNRLVRVNAIMGLARLNDTASHEKLERVLESDSSWLVRIACIRALSLAGVGDKALTSASLNDYHEQVRAIALAALAEPLKRSEKRASWSIFRVVDPNHEDKGIRREARFFVGRDGLAVVAYSDARGRIVFENFPTGDFVEGAVADLNGF